MDSLGSILNPILDFPKMGFDKVNAWQGLLVALFAVVLMRGWNQLFIIAAGATALYIVVNWAVPIAMNGQEVKLPNVMTSNFWWDAASFFVGFTIIIAMFFAVKSVVFLRGKKA